MKYLVIVNGSWEVIVYEDQTKKQVKALIDSWYKEDKRVIFEIYKVTKKLSVEDFNS